jgi:hypothetical protein
MQPGASTYGGLRLLKKKALDELELLIKHYGSSCIVRGALGQKKEMLERLCVDSSCLSEASVKYQDELNDAYRRIFKIIKKIRSELFNELERLPRPVRKNSVKNDGRE